MRGIPGSGKTPWAIKHFGNGCNAVILSSADFFMKGGRYNWVASKTPHSHTWNKNRFLSALEKGIETIVVDNTNIKAWEMQDYLNLLENHLDYEVFQKVMEIDPIEAIGASSHKVPGYAIIRMDEDFEIVEEMEHFVL